MKTSQMWKNSISIFLATAMIVSCGKKESQQVPLGKVTLGTLYIDLHEEGEVEAVNSITISSPTISWRYGNLKITQIVRDGQEVNQGDTLIIFDPSEVQKGIVEAEGGLEISLAELEKMQAQHLSDIEELRADFEVAKLSHEISMIRFESAVYESEVSKKEIELNLEKAKISLDNAQEQINNRVKIQKEEIKQKNLSIEQNRSRLKEAHETLEKLVLISPSPGIAIITHNWSSGNKYQVGDQCWSGSPLIQLPDLTLLKATTKINEVDISKISKGKNVEIKPDAFSDSLFTGSVFSVANLAVNKDNNSRVKVFPVEVYINEKSKNLLPGMTVSCRLIIDEINDVLYIPIDALHKSENQTFVYKKSGGGFQKNDVETGTRNADYVIIEKELEKGDEIALINPFPVEEKADEQTIKEES